MDVPDRTGASVAAETRKANADKDTTIAMLRAQLATGSAKAEKGKGTKGSTTDSGTYTSTSSQLTTLIAELNAAIDGAAGGDAAKVMYALELQRAENARYCGHRLPSAFYDR